MCYKGYSASCEAVTPMLTRGHEMQIKQEFCSFILKTIDRLVYSW